MGYEQDHDRQALRMTNFRIEEAVEILLSDMPTLLISVEQDKIRQEKISKETEKQDNAKDLNDFFEFEKCKASMVMVSIVELRKKLEDFEFQVMSSFLNATR